MCQQKENIDVKEKVTKGGKKGWRKVHLFNVPVNDLAFHTAGGNWRCCIQKHNWKQVYKAMFEKNDVGGGGMFFSLYLNVSQEHIWGISQAL